MPVFPLLERLAWSAATVAVVALVWGAIGGRGAARDVTPAPATPPASSSDGDPALNPEATSTLSDQDPSATTTPLQSSPAKASSETTAVPPHRGPGAVVEFDPQAAPLVRGAPAEHVAAYYEALIAQRWGTAFEMVPKTPGRGTLEGFRALHDGYSVETFRAFGATAVGNEVELLVVTTSRTDGVWNVTWRMVRTSRGLAVRDLTYARPGGAGCH